MEGLINIGIIITYIMIGFAALTGDDKQIEQLGRDKMIRKGCDLLMANPIDRYGQGLGKDANGGFLLGPKGMVRAMPVVSKFALAHQLLPYPYLLLILRFHSLV